MNTGQIVKAKNDVPYAIIPNEILQRKDMSLKAKGLISFLLSLPSNWCIYKKTLPDFFSDGRDSITTAWDELVELGYIQEVRIVSEKGNFIGWNYLAYSYPIQPESENPHRLREIRNREIRNTETPISEKPPLQRNSITKKQSNKEILDKERRGDLVFPFLDESFLKKWADWKEYKKAQFRFIYKSPMSEQAALKRIGELSGGRLDVALEIIDQSMGNGWEGLFELKKNHNGTNTTTGKRRHSWGDGSEQLRELARQQVKPSS